VAAQCARRSIGALTLLLSGQGADDIASVISNFLEGLGSAAGISLEHGEAASAAASPEASGAERLDCIGLPFITLGEDSMFVDSLFQVDEEL
jgi:hypothetical protein